MAKKVLIVAYYWPPAGGPGVQRWLKFVKYLPEFDIDPIVYVPENPNYPLVDRSLLSDVPKGVRVIKRPIFEPYGFAALFSKKKTKRISSGIIQKHRKQSLLERVMLWIRGNLFVPDARKYWVKPSVKYLSNIIETEHIDTIITTGPPHSLHLIGLRLKSRFGLQWITDFRDPWTSIGYHKKLKLMKSSHQKHKRLEKQILSTADQIIVTSDTTKKEFEHLTIKPIEVITNGYDGETLTSKLDTEFTISHIGSLLTDRNPEVLWKVLHDICLENESFKKQLRIQLIGVTGEDVLESLAKHGLSNQVSNFGYVPHDEVLVLQRKSQLLLLLEIDSAETVGIIPGKLFEYLNAGRPILAIGPKAWEAATIVGDTRTGDSFTSDDESDLKNVLLEWFEAYLKGDLQLNSTKTEQYSRRELTKKLAQTITWELS